MTRLVGIAADRAIPGVGTQHQHLADLLGVERQYAVVLEQHHRLRRGFVGQRHGIGRGGQAIGFLRINVRSLEQARLELHL